MIAKKKQVLTATLLIALIAAVAVNWYYSKTPIKSSDETTSGYDDVSGNLGDSLMVAGSVQTSQEDKDDEEQTTDKAVNTAAQEAYFAEAKLKRTQMHDETAEQIEDLVTSDKLNEDGKAELNKLLSDFQKSLKQETDTENLIKAKIQCECLVIISDNTAQVVLSQGTLNDNVLLQITEIFERNTGISAENLTIIEAK